MLFSSMIFLWLFLPIVILLNVFLDTPKSNVFLLCASLLFYSWGEPVYILLMLVSIGINWFSGILMTTPGVRKKPVLVGNVISNLFLLGYFKYWGFFAETVNAIIGREILKNPHIALPVGISFFTFQAMSYIIDLYRGKCRVQKNVFNLALYISFFPQLIAGPIVRYQDINAQIQNRSMSWERFAEGFRRFIYGLGKKVILANGMAVLADVIFDHSINNISTSIAWIGAFSYSLQIYYDFSGYSDMAIGLGKIFGFDFLENFRYPYLSRSIREFWQRWHISLGVWFREYVYIPLGGNRRGTMKTMLNLMIVFFLTGFWHGAGMTFILWGLYHGAFQILERLGWEKILKKHSLLAHCYSLTVVLIGWVLFRANSLGFALRYIAHMLLPMRYTNLASFQLYTILDFRTLLLTASAMLGCGPIQQLMQKYRLDRKLSSAIAWAEPIWLFLVFFYSIMLLASDTYNPFIYFRF